jgi:hypothetical protein
MSSPKFLLPMKRALQAEGGSEMPLSAFAVHKGTDVLLQKDQLFRVAPVMDLGDNCGNLQFSCNGILSLF